MKICFRHRNHAREHSGLYRENELLYAMKGYDEAQGLVSLLDGHWGSSIEHTSDLGCHFGYNSFLDYGAEFLCSEFSSIRDIWAFSGFTERKFSGADWKWVLYQQQVSSHNSSTRLVSKDRFEGSMPILKGDLPKNDVKAALESSILGDASKTQLCSHARRNRPKRVHMFPTMDSNVASVLCQKESVLACPAKGHACMNAVPFRTFPAQNEDRACKGQDVASRLISACAPPCVEKLCLASLLCDNKTIPLERSCLDMLSSPTGLTESIPSKEIHAGGMQHSLFSSVPPITNGLIDKKGDFRVSDDGGFYVNDQEIEMLGKALCHAQTRARLAEKLAAQTLQEADRLEQLLIREAWSTYTYRQRALALELENRLLKAHSKFEPGVWAIMENPHSCKSAEPREKASWKLAKKQHPYLKGKDWDVSSARHGNKSKPRRSVSLSCTLGFAFLLGLSIAGAGIAIVWSVGWMFFL